MVNNGFNNLPKSLSYKSVQAALFLISPLVSTMAQQQQQLQHRQFEINEMILKQFKTEPTINGSVDVAEFGQSRYAGFGHWKGHHSFFWRVIP